MFCVLADDLTGAAEIAGIALKFGLTTEIKNEFHGSADSDVLVVNTASRIVDKEIARMINKKAMDYILTLNPEWVFKKTDSVLRGHVLTEISAILEVGKLKKCLLIPANPGLGRTIVNGKYYIENREIAKTSFANDPDYPSTTSDVLELLGTYDKTETAFLTESRQLPASGVFIGEVRDGESISNWARLIDSQLLPAGAAEFFTQILQEKGYQFQADSGQLSADYGKTLFVCGSSHQNSRLAVEQAARQGAQISYLPEDLLYRMDNHLLEKWQWDIKAIFKKSDKVILTVSGESKITKEIARRIQNIFGRTIALLLLGMNLNTLVIEGGETAQEITKRLQINCFYPNGLLAAGVVELQTKKENPVTVIIKPGSYAWPESLWKFN
jgi:D-threonate/D-erythronate kinase